METGFKNSLFQNSTMNIQLIISLLSLILFFSCSPAKKNVITMQPKEIDHEQIILNFNTGPQTIIYKTRNDYAGLVPVMLSESKDEIVSYPHPSDVLRKGDSAYPTRLSNEYLLDNFGINSNVAFLRLTFIEYGQLEIVPSPETLFLFIIDKDPLLEMYNCGNKYAFRNGVNDLNLLIDRKELNKCKCLDME
jgi:hypothetical protein